ncbi:hypothetical protein ACGFY7_10775 [Streptomyces prunicolor]
MLPLVVLSLTGSPFALAVAAATRTTGYLTVGLLAGALVGGLHPVRS